MNPVAEILASNNVLLAPMAGVNEAPFRAICKRWGAGLTYTEMIGAKSLHYDPTGHRVRGILTFAAEEIPCAVQIYGSDPDMMAVQARRIVDENPGKVALIDVNMGCPVQRVVARGEGCALMRSPELAATIVRRLVEACGAPVTVKIRRGWDADHANAAEFARRMEAAGASAIAVHGRTRGQFYRGLAEWDTIRQVKAVVSVPVIGSGDVFTAADAKRLLDTTGADAVMIARGAQGHPWIFRQARALIDRGQVLPEPTPVERLQVAREHARALVEFGGEHAVVRMRKHVIWYTAGMYDATTVRGKANTCRTLTELDEVLAGYQDRLRSA
jgi:tRNA-dihydrouridine synthase B